ncbi:MAG: right-handed parallel beta-helix repeat-containing protein [Anaerolineae bacterium]|nr:right-handed parallel beta-helix repeat-containing protein [Anaerolineae bacterium]
MKRKPLSAALVMILLAGLAAAGPPPLHAAGFVVNDSRDTAAAHDKNLGDGICLSSYNTCTLRAAIEEANALAGFDTITFANQMDIYVSDSEGNLPSLTDSVTIDASSVWDSINNSPGVMLNGSNDNGNCWSGLTLEALYCAVYGLHITSFCDPGVLIASSNNTIGSPAAGRRNVLSGNRWGLWISGGEAHHNVVQGNYIGLGASGMSGEPNTHGGIFIAFEASDNTIGGDEAGEGNYISANGTEVVDGQGVLIYGPNTDRNELGGNYIGVAANNSTPMGNATSGVYVGGNAADTHIGGPGLLPNTIAHNGDHGVFIEGADNTDVYGNSILSNDQQGVYILDSSLSEVYLNTIAYNGRNGVLIRNATSLYNQIVANSIHDNGELGIDLSNGGNLNQAAPTITSASAGGASGTAVDGSRVVYVYSDYGNEGAIYHGSCVVNTATGQWAYSGAITGPNVTAIAADVDGNTSEFSLPYILSGGSGTCAAPLTISCGQQVSDDTVFYANIHDSYSCSSWPETGPEAIYQFTLAAGATYTVTATLSNLAVDLDIFLLSPTGCAAGQCQGGGTFGNFEVTVANMPAGTYYLAVDGFSGAVGTYTLNLACASGGGASHRVFLPMVVRNH